MWLTIPPPLDRQQENFRLRTFLNRDAGSCQKDGLLPARCRSQEAGFRAYREVQLNGSHLKNFPLEGEDKTSGFIDV